MYDHAKYNQWLYEQLNPEFKLKGSRKEDKGKTKILVNKGREMTDEEKDKWNEKQIKEMNL